MCISIPGHYPSDAMALASQLWHWRVSPEIAKCLLGAGCVQNCPYLRTIALRECLSVGCKFYSLEFGFECFYSLMCQKYNVWELLMQRKLSLAFVALVYSNFTTLLLNEYHCFSEGPNNFQGLLISRSEYKIIKKMKKNKNPDNYNEKPVLGIAASGDFPFLLQFWSQECILLCHFQFLLPSLS